MNMKAMRKNNLKINFLIGAVLGAIFFVGIYGFGVLNFTNDSWLLTGKDLQQHYIGWKYYRQAAWSFPLGLHDGLTHPYSVSVLYTDSIPLFAIIFKALSPILPETFQYFGLFGFMCYILNGGFASLLIARYNKSKIFCALGSVFFIISTPVLQRLFGLLTENSRHTSLASHFLIFAALAVWVYHEKFESRAKAAIVYSVLGVLCVLIQMYMIFIVGGIMCGYLLHKLIKDKDWKRIIIVFASFILSSLLTFYVIGGFTDVLIATGEGFGRYSANMNAIINPYNYSSVFHSMPWCVDQYEGLSYLGLGMFLLYLICFGYLAYKKIVTMRNVKIKQYLKQKYRKHRAAVIPLLIVLIVFWGLALSCVVFWGQKPVVQFYLPEKVISVLAIFRSSGRFMWVIMYLAMLFGLYMLTRFIKNKKVQKIILLVCVAIQLFDLSKPIMSIRSQYTSAAVEEDPYVKDAFWKTTLGNYKHIVFYPLSSCGLYQMLQIGTKASYFDMDLNYFYMSRFYTEKITKMENKKNKQLFDNNQLADDTVYITDYRTAHKYKDRYNMYFVDNRILVVKNPIMGLKKYNDVYIDAENPLLELEFSYNGFGKEFAHNGWNFPDYGEDGMWTTQQSVIRIYSGGAKKVHVAIEYEAGKKGKTTIKMNGHEKVTFDNKTSGVVEFDTRLNETTNEKQYKGINWLFLNSDKTFKYKDKKKEEQRAILVKKVTISYIK